MQPEFSSRKSARILNNPSHRESIVSRHWRRGKARIFFPPAASKPEKPRSRWKRRLGTGGYDAKRASKVQGNPMHEEVGGLWGRPGGS